MEYTDLYAILVALETELAEDPSTAVYHDDYTNGYRDAIDRVRLRVIHHEQNQ